MRQCDVAAAVGISSSLVSLIERGGRRASEQVKAGFAKLFKVPAASLFNSSGIAL
jgi:transcriptional regulator with XRE-family HTH domain